MEFLLILALGGAVIWLKSRVDRLEQRVSQYERESFPASPAVQAEVPAPDAPSATPATPSVPLVRRPDEEPPTTALEVEPESLPTIERESAHETSFAERFSAPKFQFDFEDIFGRRLPIWAGGITLAIAGVFLVRYSIESGLLTPVVRVALSFLFGVGLLGGAEWAYRNEEKIADERVRQALSGAGLATLYAAFYLAGSQYGLIGQTAAFVGLAAVTAVAVALSYRFGLPSAVLGLVGGFAAPALVGGDDANLPLLALYLGLVTGGLTFTGKRQQRPWLSIAALIFGLGWGALLLLGGDPGLVEVLALGLYFIVLGAVLPTMLGGQIFERPLRLGSAFVASVQLALLVNQGDYSPLAWALYLLLGATLAYFAWRQPRLRETSAVAAVVGILLLAQWEIEAVPVAFAVVGAGLALVYAVVPLLHIWRNEEVVVDWLQLAGLPMGIAIVCYGTYGSFERDLFEPVLALGTATLGSLPALGAWRFWPRKKPVETAVLLGASSLLAFAALLMVTPGWLAGAMASAIALALFTLLRGDDRKPMQALLWSFAGVSFVAFLGTASSPEEIARLTGNQEENNLVRATIRWIAAALPWVALAQNEKNRDLRTAGEIFAAALVYGLAAQLLPSEALTWAAALGALALWRWQEERVAAQITLLVIASLWSLEPLLEWAAQGALALMGEPMLASEVPNITTVGLRILPVAVALGVARPGWNTVFQGKPVLRLIALALSVVAAHVAFKQILSINDLSGFVDRGIAERSMWQALLFGAAWALLTGAPRFAAAPVLARGLASLALAHSIWFSFFLHQPLWDRQWVGPVPFANLVLASGAVAIAGALMIRSGFQARFRPALDGMIMGLASVTALGLLRQIYAGPILVDLPMSQGEDLLRSLLGIVLALVFLFIGNLRGERSWRVGSLVVMLIAVAKVFLVDAAGLGGLLRIASFMALGFSLIGIGWVYSRQLRTTDASG